MLGKRTRAKSLMKKYVEERSMRNGAITNNGVSPARVPAAFRRVLRASGFSQVELAERVGVTPAAISRDLKHGLRKAQLDRLQRLASAIGYDVVVFLRPHEHKTQPTRKTHRPAGR